MDRRYSFCRVAVFAVCALLPLADAQGQTPRQPQRSTNRQPQNPGTSRAAQAQPRRQPAGPNRPTAGQNDQPQPDAQGNVQIVPFRLTPQQQAELDRVLHDWEQQSKKIKSLNVRFKLWEYDDVFQRETSKLGKLTYAAPDKGSYEVEGDEPERWVCDGDAVYEYNYEKKELIERKLPPDLKGHAIAKGPLPFLLGASAKELKRRYFMRIVTPENVDGQIWIEARPRFREDAANFARAELILRDTTLLPYAIQLHLPNDKTRTVHQFYDEKVNDLLAQLIPKIFAKPLTPPGWKRTVEEAPNMTYLTNGGNVASPGGGQASGLRPQASGNNPRTVR